MRSFPERVCRLCPQSFLPKGPCNLYCPACAPAQKKKVARASIDRYRQRILGAQVGIGTGQANKKGAEDELYKTGICFFRRMSRLFKATIRYCQSCNKDLVAAGPAGWALHHRDGNRMNNVVENFELLCKRCHQLTHNCTANLPYFRRQQQELPLAA